MINESLQFLAEEVNKYLNFKKPNLVVSKPRLVVSNVAATGDTNTNVDPKISDVAILSLVNIEEDRVAKLQENYMKTSISTLYKNPPVFLNLYILFSMNRDSYAENLDFLSHVIRFFQHQNVFTPVTHPSLNSNIQKLMVDLHTLTFEQSNHLWSILGGKYMPSIMYKVRQVTMDENAIVSESGLIKEIVLTDKTKTPVS